MFSSFCPPFIHLTILPHHYLILFFSGWCPLLSVSSFMHSALIEQTRFRMWTRRKLNGRPLLDSMSPPITAPPSYHKSWEEQAFAEDSAGHLGGCVWPPRSYSCSFCGREFRSAQALGGHMNVHRRDRARLKQSSSSGSDNHQADHHHQHLNHVSTPGTLLGYNYSVPRVSTLVNSRNPNPNPNLGTAASALSPSRVSPSYPASINIEECRKGYLLSNPQIFTGAIPARLFSVLELRLGRENWKPKEVGFLGPIEDDEDETTSRKRKRDDPNFPLFMKPSPGERKLLSTEVIKTKPNPAMEELDLELRLGDLPKVK